MAAETAKAMSQPSPLRAGQVLENGPANHTSVSDVSATVNSRPVTMPAIQATKAGHATPPRYQ